MAAVYIFRAQGIGRPSSFRPNFLVLVLARQNCLWPGLILSFSKRHKTSQLENETAVMHQSIPAARRLHSRYFLCSTN